MTTAAFHWDSKNNEIAMIVIDKSNFSVIEAAQCTSISSFTDIDREIKSFVALIHKYNVSEVEYQILQKGTPAHPLRSTPLSDHCIEEFERSVISRNPQKKKKLSGDALKKWKSGLKDLGLLTGAPKAWEWHLWTVALHVTASNVTKKLRTAFQKIKCTSTKKKDVDKQFDEWHSGLG